jgi:hypothetical protein
MKLTPGKAKSGFFDRAKVKSSISKAERKKLGAFGAFVRSVARNSIRKPPKKGGRSSLPGRPPYDQTGLLKKFLFFSYDFSTRSVVIGPAKLNRRGKAPAVLEYGGSTIVGRGSTRRLGYIKPRPYMEPAFDEGIKRGASLWKDSIK